MENLKLSNRSASNTSTISTTSSTICGDDTNVRNNEISSSTIHTSDDEEEEIGKVDRKSCINSSLLSNDDRISCADLLGSHFTSFFSSKEKLSERLSTLSFKDMKSIKDGLQIAQKWKQRGYNPYQQDVQGYTALHRAARKGDIKLIESLLANYEGADLIEYIMKKSFNHQQTAIHVASRLNDFNVIRSILEFPRICNDTRCISLLNDPDKHGNTSLHFAASKTETDLTLNPMLMDEKEVLINFLLSHGANPNVENHLQLNPLAVHLLTSTSCNTSIAKTLLQYGTNPNGRTLDGNTLLHTATKRGFWEIASLLIQSGASMNIPNKQGKMVCEIVSKNQFKKLAQSFTKPPIWVSSQTRQSCMLCEKSLTILRRAHHCRMCGRICCHACSKYRKNLMSLYSSKSRCKDSLSKPKDYTSKVCRTCFQISPDLNQKFTSARVA